MIFNNCNWVSARWQWSINCTQIENKQLYTWGETIRKHRTNKIEANNTKQEKKHKMKN
jgi:hypothetical protein